MGVADASSLKVFQQERHAAKGAVGESASSFCACFFKTLMNDRVQLRIDRFDARDGSIDKFSSGNIAVADEFCLCSCIEPGKICWKRHIRNLSPRHCACR